MRAFGTYKRSERLESLKLFALLSLFSVRQCLIKNSGSFYTLSLFLVVKKSGAERLKESKEGKRELVRERVKRHRGKQREMRQKKEMTRKKSFGRLRQFGQCDIFWAISMSNGKKESLGQG